MDSDAKTLINDIIDAIRVGDFKRLKKTAREISKTPQKIGGEFRAVLQPRGCH